MNLGLLFPDWLPLCSDAKVVFTVTRLSKGRAYGKTHRVCTVAEQTVGDICRQLQRESKLQRQCFQTAGLQMSQWWRSRSVEPEPMGLIVGHSWSACLNSVKSPRQTEATHPLCVTRCSPDQSVHGQAATPDRGSYICLCLLAFRSTRKTFRGKSKLSNINKCKKVCPVYFSLTVSQSECSKPTKYF